MIVPGCDEGGLAMITMTGGPDGVRTVAATIGTDSRNLPTDSKPLPLSPRSVAATTDPVSPHDSPFDAIVIGLDLYRQSQLSLANGLSGCSIRRPKCPVTHSSVLRRRAGDYQVRAAAIFEPAFFRDNGVANSAANRSGRFSSSLIFIV